MTHEIKFSVITVCLNCKDIIEQTILSVLSQSFHSIEYIVIDGKSSDGTLNILRKYQDKIRIISEPDNGIYDAMNKGIRLSRGQFLYFLNAGDQFTNSETLQEIEKFSTAHPDCSVIYGDIQISNSAAKWIMNNKTYIGEIKNLRYLFNNMFCQQRAFFQRSIFNSIGMLDTSYKIISDYDLIFRAYQKGLNFGYVHTDIVSIPLGGYSNIHLDQFLKERIRSLFHLPWWRWYWIFDHVIGAISRGSINKYFKTKLIKR